jgi:hypothetical protein
MRLALASMVLASGCADPFDVAVRVVTDYRASEVDLIQVELGEVPFEVDRRVVEVDVEPGDDLLAGKTLVVEQVAGGDYYVTATLLRAGEPLVERRTVVELDEARTLRLSIGRSCETVECGAAQTCVSGTCVSEGCSELAPELCPAACAADSECPADGCLLGRCVEGACMLVAGDPIMCP